MLNLPITTNESTHETTMSSIDLAILCVGTSKDAHSDFVKKMKNVLGESKLGNFSELKKIKDLDGHCKGTRTIYNLPEREACLMAMSYSYSLQAEIYDAWKELEKSLTPVQRARRELAVLERMEVLALENKELERTKAEISNKKTATAMATASTQSRRAKKIGSELEDITNDTYLYTPTDAGKRLDMSAYSLNQMLLNVGWIYIDHGVKLPTIKTENRGIFKTMNNKYQTLGITESGIEIIETELIIA